MAVLIHLHNRSFRGTSKGMSLVTSTCPHAYLNFREDSGAIEIVPTFFKPVGRFDFICQRCGLRNYLKTIGDAGGGTRAVRTPIGSE